MRPIADGFADLVDYSVRRAPRRVQRTRLGQRLLAEIALRERYRTGRRFTAAIQEFMAPNRGHTMYETWLDYALGTNLRGATIVDRLARLKPIRGCRALDVGCAYGGVSLAFADAGAAAVGIDVDENLLRFAALNVADRRAAVELARVDVTDGARMHELGRFDFVTCSDVIEHVADVPATLANLAAILAPGGILELHIPNGRAAGLVVADGHFNAFAITLLERPDALRYFAEGGFGTAYDVHTYLPLDAYLEMLARFGVHPEGRPVQNQPDDADGAVRGVVARLPQIEAAALELSTDRRLSEETRAGVARAVARYVEDVRRAAAALERQRDTAADDERVRAFVRDNAIECWDVVARKRD